MFQKVPNNRGSYKCMFSLHLLYPSNVRSRWLSLHNHTETRLMEVMLPFLSNFYLDHEFTFFIAKKRRNSISKSFIPEAKLITSSHSQMDRIHYLSLAYHQGAEKYSFPYRSRRRGKLDVSE